MDRSEILEYLRRDPECARILKLAIEHEERNKGNPNYLGWEWYEVRAHASTINRLVVDGLASVSFHSSTTTYYRLTDLEATKEALEKFYEQPRPEEEGLEIPDDLFSPILGYDDVKEIIRRSLEQERPVGFLLVGPVATAKSLFLEELNRIRGSSYHLGSSSTKAGLTQFLLEYRPRILLIDEFDKMRREDYAALLSLMEGGKVVETKYGRRREEHLKVWVFASCNRLDGIPPENISRFRPYIFHFKEYTREEFMRVAEKLLVEREGLDPALARYIAERASALTKDVRAARGLGRLCRTAQDVDRYIEILVRYQGFYPSSPR